MSEHTCPAPECEVRVPQRQLACKRHWFALPSDIRGRVWASYRAGDTAAHLQAMADAVEFLAARAHADG